MQKINIIAVGTLKEQYLLQAQQEYSKRLQTYCNLRIQECKEPNVDTDKKLKIEAQEIEKHITKGCTILLDPNGKQVSSMDISQIIKQSTFTFDIINFVIGGSNGIHNNLHTKSNHILSFGSITMPHQLFRIVLLEQIYRAYTIIQGKEYHK